MNRVRPGWSSQILQWAGPNPDKHGLYDARATAGAAMPVTTPENGAKAAGQNQRRDSKESQERINSKANHGCRSGSPYPKDMHRRKA